MEAFALLDQGQTYIDLPERLRRYRSDVFTDKYKRLAWSELCRSITAHIAKDGYWYIHPDQHRTLSIREAARVQTFPDDFQFAGNQTHRFRQIGNAVPVKLAKGVGESIVSALNDPAREAPATDVFRQRLTDWHSEQPVLRPWRTGGEPWAVLACELCLRRAPATFVAATYPRLMELAPSARALARRGEPAAALRAIGLKASSELLVDVAHDLVERFGGKVPEDETEMRSLPGVGEYVCQAVRCFGFGRRVVLVDQVTSRVCTRVSARERARRFQLRLDLHRLAGSRGPDAEFNRALFELGEATCRVNEPRCTACPVRELCAFGSSRAGGLQLELDDQSARERAPILVTDERSELGAPEAAQY
jgi:DNA (cytosine-5)-methyltransferase 1